MNNTGWPTCVHGVWVNDHCRECAEPAATKPAPEPKSAMKDENVITFDGVTAHSLPPERVLKGAVEHGMKMVLVIGWDEEGDFYFAGSDPSGPENLWVLEVAKKKLIEVTGD